MANKIQIRRDVAANWTSSNPTLSQGEQGYETDTGKIKIGDGSTAWTSLSYSFEGAVLELYAENPSSPTAPSATGTNAVSIGSNSTATGLAAVAIGQGDGDAGGGGGRQNPHSWQASCLQCRRACSPAQ